LPQFLGFLIPICIARIKSPNQCHLSLFVNSEIEGEVETMRDDTREKLGPYNTGQTVTCFVRKVRSEKCARRRQQVEVTPEALT